MALNKKTALEAATNYFKEKASQSFSNIKNTASEVQNKAGNAFKNFYDGFSKDYENYKKTQTESNTKTQKVLNDRLFSTSNGKEKSSATSSLGNYTPPKIEAPNLFKIKDSVGDYVGKFSKRSSEVFEPAMKRAKGVGVASTGLLLDLDKKISNSPVMDYIPGGASVKAIMNMPGVSEGVSKQSDSLLKKGTDIIAQADKEKDAKVKPLESKSFLENLKNPEWLAEGLTYNAPSFLTSLGIGAVGSVLGGPVVGFISAMGPSYLLTAGDVYDEAKKNGANEEMAKNAANITGIASGLLDAVGIGNILERVAGKETRGLVVKEMIKNMAKSATSEGTTESMQQLLQNAVAKVSYDTKRDLMSGLLESGFFGGILGGVGSAGVDITKGTVDTYNLLTPQEKQAGFVRVSPEKEATNLLETSQNNPVDENLAKVMGKLDNLSSTKEQGIQIDNEDVDIVKGAISRVESSTSPENFLNKQYGIDNSVIRDFARKYVNENISDTEDIYNIISLIQDKIEKQEIQQTEQIGEKNNIPEESTKGDYVKEISNMEVPLGEATLKTKKGNEKVIVTEYLGVGKDGNHYVSIEGSQEPVLLSSLEFEGKKERGLITSIKENETNREDVKSKVYGVYDTTTDEGRMNAGRDYVRENRDIALSRAMSNEPLTNELIGIYYALDEDLSSLADEAEKAGDKERARILDNQVVELDNKLAGKITEKAQILQFTHKWSERSPAAFIRWAERIYEQANENKFLSPSRLVNKALGKEYEISLSKEMRAEILAEIKKIKKLPAGEERNSKTLDLMRKVTEPIPPSLMQYTDAYRYENMLISPRTHFKNIFSNLVNAEFLYPSILWHKGAIDFLHSAITGKEREYLMSDMFRYYRGQINGVSQGFKEFSDVINSATSVLDIETKYGDNSGTDIAGLQGLTGEKMPWYLSIAKRLLAGEDRFFTNMIAAGEKDIQLSKGATEEVANKKALETASYWLYNNKTDPSNKTGQGEVLASLDRLKEFFHKGNKNIPLLKYFVPFVNIVVNVAKANLEYNPITGPATLWGSTRKTEQIAKMMHGSYVMLGFAALAAQGMTTWAPPDDEKTREAFYATGRKPYSFYNPVIDAWIPFSYLGNLQYSAATPAAIEYHMSQSKKSLTNSQLEALEKGLMDTLGFFLQSTPVSGLEGFIQTAQGKIDTSWEKAAAYTMTQFIPWNSALRYINTIIDPIFRKSSGFGDEIKKSIPGATFGLEPYKTPSGEESKRNLSDYIAPWSVGKTNDGFEGLYKDRLNEAQQRAVTREIEKASESGGTADITNSKNISEKDVKDRMKVYFETDNAELRKQIEDNLIASGWNIGDAVELMVKSKSEKDLKGMSTESQKMLNRSNDFEVVRKLIETYGDRPDADKIIGNKMKEKGITSDDMLYDNQTAMPEDVRYEEIVSGINGLESDSLFEKLISYRRESEGTRKMLLTNGLIDNLVEDSIITKDQARALKNVTWDSKKQEFKTKVQSGRSSGGLKIKAPKIQIIKPGKVSVPDIKFVKIKSPDSNYKLIKAKKPKLGDVRKLKVRQVAPAIKRSAVRNIKQLGRIA